MRTVFTAKRLWDGQSLHENPILLVADDQIARIETSATAELPPDTQVIDFPGALLAPSFFDVHIHGAAGHDVMEATPEALSTIGRFLASRGTANFLATTVSAPLDATLRSVERLARLIAQPAAEGRAHPIGIHLEGPFLSHAKRGVHPPQHLLTPDIAVFDRIFEAADGRVRLMTLAPELAGAAELAFHATARGVRVSVGHSNATAEETRAVLTAGATSATHTFNAMRPLDHREPGILGTVLTTDSLYAELICDGVHTAPEIVRLWWRTKGEERAILVTDAMSATGMPEGEYQLGGFPVQVANGRAMVNGVLAGSVLTLDLALKNFLGFTGARVEQAMRLLSRNAAAMTGLDAQAGSLQIGGRADFVAVDPAGALVASVIGGRICP
jgi:N-acetylglucosamine-6-phosphate deacetylase